MSQSGNSTLVPGSITPVNLVAGPTETLLKPDFRPQDFQALFFSWRLCICAPDSRVIAMPAFCFGKRGCTAHKKMKTVAKRGKGEEELGFICQECISHIHHDNKTYRGTLSSAAGKSCKRFRRAYTCSRPIAHSDPAADKFPSCRPAR